MVFNKYLYVVGSLLMVDKASVVDEESWSSVCDLLGHPEPDALVSLDQLYQLIPEQLVEHRVETF